MYVWFICMLAVSKLSVPLFVSILPGPWRKQPPLSGGLAPSSVVVYGIESTSGSGRVSSLRLHHQVKLSNNYKEISYFRNICTLLLVSAMGDDLDILLMTIYTYINLNSLA